MRRSTNYPAAIPEDLDDSEAQSEPVTTAVSVEELVQPDAEPEGVAPAEVDVVCHSCWNMTDLVKDKQIDVDSLDAMKITDLKAALKARNLPTIGNFA